MPCISQLLHDTQSVCAHGACREVVITLHVVANIILIFAHVGQRIVSNLFTHNSVLEASLYDLVQSWVCKSPPLHSADGGDVPVLYKLRDAQRSSLQRIHNLIHMKSTASRETRNVIFEYPPHFHMTTRYIETLLQG